MSLNIDAERISTASDRGCTRSGTGNWSGIKTTGTATDGAKAR